jgi:hypothetical protein
MPTIHREAGFRFGFFPNDHPPPHVHATNRKGAMKVYLGDEKTASRIHSIVGLKEAEARTAFRIILANKAAFLAKWREWHG